MSNMDPSVFGERIGELLRTRETLDASFEERLMTAVHAVGPYAGRRPARFRAAMRWFIRPQTVQLSPLSGLVLAAGVAGVVALGALTITRRDAGSSVASVPSSVSSSASRHSRVVHFVITAPGAAQVALVGDFNDWDANATMLERASEQGVWTVALPLETGRYEYAFVVNGSEWLADPTSPEAVEDDYGKPNSVVTVGGQTI